MGILQQFSLLFRKNILIRRRHPVTHEFSGCSISAHRSSFLPHFIKIVVEVKASGPPHVLILWLVVSKGIFAPCSLFCVSVELKGDHKTVYKDEGILALEVGWPVLIVVVIALIRLGVPPQENIECHYQDRALPSAGLVPFLHTFICNLDNKCHSQISRNAVQENIARVSAFIQEITPYLDDPSVKQMLNRADSAFNILHSVNKIDSNVLTKIDNATYLYKYFKNPNKIKTIMVTRFYFSQQSVDALMNAQANLSAVLELHDYPDLRGIACNPIDLSKFLHFPTSSDKYEVSHALCNVNDSMIPHLTEFLQSQFDIAEFIRLIGYFEELKKSLSMFSTLNEALMDVADMLDLSLSGNETLFSLFHDLSTIDTLPVIIRSIPMWVNTMQSSSDTISFILKMIEFTKPHLPESLPWHVFSTMEYLLYNISMLINHHELFYDHAENSNQLITDALYALQDIIELFHGINPHVKQVLDFILSINSGKIGEIMTSSRIKDKKFMDIFYDGGTFVNKKENNSWIIQTFGPLIYLTSMTLKTFHSEMEVTRNTFSIDSPLAVLVRHLTSYAPEIVENMMDFRENGSLGMMLHMMFSNDPLSKICAKNGVFLHLSVPYNVAMEMQEALCLANWKTIMYRVMSIESTFSLTVKEVLRKMDLNDYDMNLSSLENYWSELVHYFNILADMSSSTDFFEMASTSYGPWKFLMFANVSQVAEAANILNNMVFHMSTDELVYVTNMTFSTIEHNIISTNQTSLLMTWKRAKHYVRMLSDIGILLQEYIDQRKVISFNESLQQFPEEIHRMIFLTVDASIDVIDALGMILSHYELFSQVLMKNGFQLPNCKDVTLTKYLLLDPNSSLGRLEDELCLDNWTDTLRFYQAQTFTPASIAVSNLMIELEGSSDTGVNPEVNWTMVVYTLSQTVESVFHHLSDMSNPMIPYYFPPFNSSAINVHLKQFYHNLDIFRHSVFDNLDSYDTNLQSILQSEMFSQISEINTFPNVLNSNMYLNFHLIKFINTQLKYFNTSKTIHILDLFGSSELVKAATILQYSPEINEIVIDTFMRIASNISHLMDFDFGNICDNMTVFLQLVVIDNTSIDPYLLQNMVCNLNISTEQILNELLQNWKGFHPFINSVMLLIESNFTLSVNQSELLVEQAEYAALLNDLIARNPTIVMYDPEDKWMNSTVYSKSLINLKLKFDNLNADFFMSQHIISLIKTLAEVEPEFAGFAGFVDQVIVELDLFLDRVLQMRKGNQSLSEIFQDYSQLKLVMLLMRHLPQVSDTVIHNIISSPLKMLEMFVQWMSVGCVCDVDINTFMLILPDDYNMTELKEILCNIDTIMLMKELFLSINMDNTNAVNEKLDILFSEFHKQFIRKQSIDSDRSFNWSALIFQMPDWYPKAFLLSNSLSASNISVLHSLLRTFRLMPMFNDAVAILVGVLDVMELQIHNSYTPLSEGFSPYKNLSTFLSLLEDLPEVFEVVLYTALKHKEKMSLWAPAITSRDILCNTDASILMTAPVESNISVYDILYRLCTLNSMQLLTELSQYQHQLILQEVIVHEYKDAMNSSDLIGQMSSIIESIERLVSSTDQRSNLRLFNQSVWESVFSRIRIYLNSTQRHIALPQLDVIASNLLVDIQQELVGHQPEQSLIMMELFLDEMLLVVKGNRSIEELLEGSPNMKFVMIQHQLPKILDSFFYALLNSPEKILDHVSSFSSWEKFCSTDIDLILTNQPQIDFNMTHWRQVLCSVDLSFLFSELMTAQEVVDISSIFSPNSTFAANLSVVHEKLKLVLAEIEKIEAVDFNVYLNSTSNLGNWNGAMHYLETLMDKSDIFVDNSSDYSDLVSSNAFGEFLQLRIIKECLMLLMDILDVVEIQLHISDILSSDTLTSYPNVQSLLRSLSGAPEIVEIMMYTFYKDSQKLALWKSAMSSWDDFCNTSHNVLLIKPENYHLPVEDVFIQICSINSSQLIFEVNQLLELQTMITDDIVASHANVTDVIEELNLLIRKFELRSYIPLDVECSFYFCNSNVWQNIFQTLSQYLNSTDHISMPDDILLNLIRSLFSNKFQLNDGFQWPYSMQKMTDFFESKLDLLGGDNFTDNYPSIQSMLAVLQHLPEVYETITLANSTASEADLESVIYHFQSLEKFCNSTNDELLLMPNSSHFNFSSWHSDLCSLNVTLLHEELSHLLTSYHKNTSVNLTYLIEKIVSVLSTSAESNMLTENNPIMVDFSHIDIVVRKLEMMLSNMTYDMSTGEISSFSLWKIENDTGSVTDILAFFNLLMNNIIDAMHGMIYNRRMDTLLLHSKDLVNLMMKYVTLAQFTPSVWMNDGLNISMVMQLPDEFKLNAEICADWPFEVYPMNGSIRTNLAAALQTVLCTIATELYNISTLNITNLSFSNQLEVFFNQSSPFNVSVDEYKQNINEMAILLRKYSVDVPIFDQFTNISFSFSDILDVMDGISVTPHMLVDLLLKAVRLFDMNNTANEYYSVHGSNTTTSLLFNLMRHVYDMDVPLTSVLHNAGFFLATFPAMASKNIFFDFLDALHLQPKEVINIEYPGDASHNSDTLIFQTSGVLSTLDITIEDFTNGNDSVDAIIMDRLDGIHHFILETVTNLSKLHNAKRNIFHNEIWTDFFLQQLNLLSMPKDLQMNNLCNMLNASFEKATGFYSNHTMLSLPRILHIVTKTMPLVREFCSTACYMHLNNSLSIPTNHSLDNILEQIVHLTMNSTEVSCSEIANSFLSLKSFFKQTQSVSSVNFTKDELLMCLQSNFDSIISSLDEIKSIYDVLNNISGLLEKNDISVLLENTDQISHLFDFVNMIFADNVGNMLNHDDQLQISTPLPVALENLRNFFPASLRDFFRSHMNMTTIELVPLAMDPLSHFVLDILNDVATLFENIPIFMELSKGRHTADMSFLSKFADCLDALSTKDISLKNLENILNIPQNAYPEKYYRLVEDFKCIVSGFIGINHIIAHMHYAVQVSALLKDPYAAHKFLVNDLQFSERTADAILQSYFSFHVFIDSSESLVLDRNCDEQLANFVLLNTTDDLQQEITDRFCALNSSEFIAFMKIIMPELSIGDLVQQYVRKTGLDFLQSYNLTEKDVEDTFVALIAGGESLRTVFNLIVADNTSQTPLLTGADGEFEAFVGLQPTLCGKSNLDVADDFNLKGKLGGDIPASFEDEIHSSTEFCQKLYRDVRAADMGAVIWSYIKPLIQGKILFTPDTALTRQIIKESNWVFNVLDKVRNVSKLWSESVPLLSNLSSEAELLSAMEKTLASGFSDLLMQTALSISASSFSEALKNIMKNNLSVNDLHSLQSASELIYNYSNCIEIDRFEGVVDEAALEARAIDLYKNKNFFAGVVFLDLDKTSSLMGSRPRRDSGIMELPSHIRYKIRMDIDNTATTNRLKDRLWMPYSRDSFINHLRYMHGFILLQDLVDGAILRLHTGTNHSSPAVSMQQMPFPCNMKDDYMHFIGSYLLPVIMTFAWLSSLGIATYNLVYERQDGQEETLHIMGLRPTLNFLAWLLVTMLIMAIISVVMTVVLFLCGIFRFSNWIIVFLFLLEFCLSSLLLCYFISAFFTRVTIAILIVLIVYVITYLPYIVLVSVEVHMNKIETSLASLSSTAAFSFAAIIVTHLEESTEGLQWNNLDKVLQSQSVSFSWLSYMILFDSFIYLVLGWYIRNLKPGKYGVAQVWYFPIQPSYWCDCFTRPHIIQPLSKDSNFHILQEPPPLGLDVGVSIRNLWKTYKRSRVAVRGLNIDIYRGQVTTLVGPNGAGKTTTLNMIVGVLAASKGIVFVNGVKSYRRIGILGICPQHNPLFEYMTVEEHMDFYGQVKSNYSKSKLKNEIEMLLKDVGLWRFKDVLASLLSEGMKRRLCVALAFVGGSKTVVLDEPTSGVDPYARKKIWNLITRSKVGRTILLTTHHMDEADLLSDRILMLHLGELLCVGSPSFLKDQVSEGYNLILHTQPDMCETMDVGLIPRELDFLHAQITKFIKAHFSSVKFVESRGNDLIVKIPKHQYTTDAMCDFFGCLDKQGATMGVMNYSVSNNTLEEVFLEFTSPEKPSAGEEEKVVINAETHITAPSVHGFALKMHQLTSLFKKRINHYRRNWLMVVSTVVLPIVAMAIAMACASLRQEHDEMKTLLLSPALYSTEEVQSFAFIRDNTNSEYSNHFMVTLLSDENGIGTTCMKDFDAGLEFHCVKPDLVMNQSPMFEIICQCMDFAFHCEHSHMKENVTQMVTRPAVILQNLKYKHIDSYLVDSYMNYYDRRFGGWTLEPDVVDVNISRQQIKVWFNNKGYHASPAYFNALSNILLRAAVNRSDYGITAYSHPLMLNREKITERSVEMAARDIGISMTMLLALSFIPSAFMVYLINEKRSQQRHLQAISGVGNVLYWTASFFWDLIIYSFTLGCVVLLSFIFKSTGFYDRENLRAFALLLFLYGWAIIPIMYCMLPFFNDASTAYLTLFCCSIFIGMISSLTTFVFDLLYGYPNLRAVSNILQYAYLIFPQYSLAMGLVDLVTNQIQYELLSRFGEDTYVSPFCADMLLWKFVSLAALGFFFFLLNNVVQSVKPSAMGMRKGAHYGSDVHDEDVDNETQRVHSGSNDSTLVVKDLCKVYKRGNDTFCAVSHLNFGVYPGECFGLLGTNGAGKTTVFSMLTGFLPSSYGDVFLHHHKLGSSSILSNLIGYCPQENALDLYLTGRETLLFYAALLGYNSKHADQLARQQLNQFSLECLADDAICSYSGGNRRKLCLAVSMLGNPSLLLLDEPTTGMDVRSRSRAWKCIKDATARGQSVLLSSHSMIECESLCGRIGIMVNGQLKCIGSPQHLRDRFGDGYLITLYLKEHSGDYSVLAESISSYMMGSVVTEHQPGVLQVSVPHETVSVPDIFCVLQHIVDEINVSSYSIQHISLDGVFSKFASEHMENWPHNGMAEEQDVYNTANLPPTSVNVDEHFHHSSGVVDNYIDPTPTPTAGSTESFKPDKQRIAVVQSSPSALSQQLEQELLDIRL